MFKDHSKENTMQDLKNIKIYNKIRFTDLKQRKIKKNYITNFRRKKLKILI